MKPFWSQWKADVMRTLRDRRFLLVSLMMPAAFYLIFTHDGNAKIGGTYWGAYFMVSMTSFGVVGASVNTLGVRLAAERQGGWVRWLRTTPLSPAGYGLAKIATQLAMSLIIVGIVFAVARFDQKVTLAPTRWLSLIGWIWIGSVPFAALGVLIGMAGTSVQALGTLVYISMSLLGGLWTPQQSLPPSMRAIAHWMPTYRYAEPAWNLLSGRNLGGANLLILVAYTALFIVAAVLIQRRQDSHPEAD
jgi:ABC-2 type transport system permease protein